MAVPKYDDFYKIFLRFVNDCQEHIKRAMNLTASELAEINSHGHIKWLARVDWCIVTLEKAGMIFYPKQDSVQLTDAGRELEPEKVTTKFLIDRGAPALLEFIKMRRSDEPAPLPPAESPADFFQRTYNELNAALAEKLLEILLGQSPIFFEKLTVKLMERMGYGIGAQTSQSNDGGIDGIIFGDKLGFERIGIQAKLWGADKVVGRPEIQKFYGALASSEFGKLDKGLFVTTAKFSAAAQRYADEQRIILIDGKRLAEPMIEFEVGIVTEKIYKLKRIDGDFFDV